MIYGADGMCQMNQKGGKTSMAKEKIGGMRNKVEKGICAAALSAARHATEFCHLIYFEPKEPDGMREFLNGRKEQ